VRGRRKSARRQVIDVAQKYEPDPAIKGNMLDLKKSIDLILWLVDLFLKGGVEEEHFNQFFDAYEFRLEQSLKRRSQMLDNARDLKPLQKALNEAKLYLSELEKKKIIGDISDEEYDLKVPVYKWDIAKYEREIAKRNIEISILENLTQVMSEEDITEMKETAESSKGVIDDLLQSGDISPENATRIKESLEKTLAACKSLKNNK